ncbi:hypothetical protein BZL30_2016 [Mycobacterium kansasii]|uniref:Uncharacterized protein n=1 Tax=Mycobacterium kansasii TaxID=1768 RepID=A0A1V3XH01_MYCKA|nr:hypothetical protein BZL30_2016 [Mycobacterium kansasii]
MWGRTTGDKRTAYAGNTDMRGESPELAARKNAHRGLS